MGLGTAERRSSAAAAKHPPCRTSHCNKLHTEASTEESATTTRHPTQRGAPTTPSDQEEIQLTSNHRTQPSGRYDQQASQQYPKCRTTQLQPAATSQTRRPIPSRPSPNIHDTYRDPRGTSNIKKHLDFLGSYPTFTMGAPKHQYSVCLHTPKRSSLNTTTHSCPTMLPPNTNNNNN